MDNSSLELSKWNCKYHMVFELKYRRQVIYGKISLNNTSKTLYKLTEAMKVRFKSNGMDFSEVKVKNDTSDQKSFEKKNISIIYIILFLGDFLLRRLAPQGLI